MTPVWQNVFWYIVGVGTGGFVFLLLILVNLWCESRTRR